MRPADFLRRDDGAVVAFVAVAFIAIIAFAILIIDMGMSFSVKTQLREAADAAALAGCQQIIKQSDRPDLAQDAARQVAITYARGAASGLTDSNITVDIAAGGKVTVDIALDVPLFSAMFGDTDVPVAVRSIAEPQRLRGARYVAPWGWTIVGRPSSVRYEIRSDAGAVVRSGSLAAVDASGQAWQGTINRPDTEGLFDLYLFYSNELGAEETLYDANLNRAQAAFRIASSGASLPLTAINPTGPLYNLYEGPTAAINRTVWYRLGAVQSGMSVLAYEKNYSLATYSARPVINGVRQTIAYVHVARPNSAISSLVATPLAGPAGTAFTVDVTFSGFDPRKVSYTRSGATVRSTYLRRAASSSYTGDYVQLDYASLDHSACGVTPMDTSRLAGMTLASWIKRGYPGSVHLDDTMPVTTVSASQLNGYLVTDAAGRKYSIMPVVMRSASNRVRVVGFVPAYFTDGDAFQETAIMQVSGDYAATPHEFDVAPAAAQNVVLAPRLVRQ